MPRLRLKLRLLVRLSRLLILSTVGLFAASIVRGEGLRDVFGEVLVPDFVAHYTGGWLAGSPERLYDIEAQRALQLEWLADPTFLDLYLSPPHVAPFYAPFARLPLGAAMAAWVLFSGLCLGLAYAILRRDALPIKRSHERLFVLFALAFQPLQALLGGGQDTAVTILLWAGGIHLALGRRDALAGLVLGLGAFKPQLFLLPLLYLVVRSRWRAVAGVVASASALGALGLLLHGLDGYRAWVAILRSQTYLLGTRQASLSKMHSIVASIEALLPPGRASIAWWVGHAIMAIVAAATLRVARRMRSPRHVWSLLVVATVLVSPHLFTYDLSLLLVPALLLLGERWSRAMTRAALAVAALTWLSPARAQLVAGLGWPASILAGSWTPIPLAFLWREIARRGLAPGRPPHVD